MTRQVNKIGDQAGVALISAIFVVLFAVLIGFALSQSTLIAMKVATNERDKLEAFYVADAGINHAVKLLNRVPVTQFSNVLTSGTNTTPNTGDELSQPPSIGLWTSAQSIPAGNTSGGGITNFGAGGAGRYWVSIRNDTGPGETATVDNNRTLIITSNGFGRNGAAATIEATFQVPLISEPAIIVDGRAVVVGVPTILGSNGIIHANDTLTILGVTCTEQYASSSGNISILLPALLHHKGPGCTAAGVERRYQSTIPVAVHNIPAEFRGRADFVLGGNGSNARKIFDKNGSQIGTSPWNNAGAIWTWDGLLKTWTMIGIANPNGVYYSEGNIILAGITASLATPAKATMVAEGYISVVGATYVQPALDSYSLIAGTDLLIAGILGNPGRYYARDQFDIIGTTSVTGSIRSANKFDGPSPGGLNPVTRVLGALNLTGVFTLTNNEFPASDGVVTGWREIRN